MTEQLPIYSEENRKESRSLIFVENRIVIRKPNRVIYLSVHFAFAQCLIKQIKSMFILF